MADNDDALEALEEAGTGEAEDAEAAEGASSGPEAEETSEDSSGSGEGATAESAAEQIAALAARIDGIANEIGEIRRWFKMSTIDDGESEEGPDDLSFDALADFIIGEG
jgi:hypothetical protein